MAAQSFRIFALLFPSLLLLSCSDNCANVALSGRLTSESRVVGLFRAVNLKSGATVYVSIADSQTVRVEADENVIGKITTHVHDGVLTIGTVPGVCSNGSMPMTVYVTLPALRSIDLDGSGKVSVAGRVAGDSLRLAMTGSGVLDVEAETAVALETIISGSGIIMLRGTAGLHSVRLDGSGIVNAFDLPAARTSVRLGGSGIVRVMVREELHVALSGSGLVEYQGEPAILDIQVSGSGRVVRVR